MENTENTKKLKDRIRKSKLLTVIVMASPLIISAAIVLIILRLMFSPANTLGPLQKAALSGDLEGVRKEILAGVNVDQTSDSRKWTALHAASYSGELDVVEFLVKKGADINKRDKYGYAPLHNTGDSSAKGHPSASSEIGRAKVAEFLLENGADIKAMTPHDETALHGACATNSPNVAEVLLERGADPNIQNKQGMSPLHLCCSWNRNTSKIIELLFKHGADPLLKDEHGRTAEDLAREHNTNVLATIQKHTKQP